MGGHICNAGHTGLPVGTSWEQTGGAADAEVGWRRSAAIAGTSSPGARHRRSAAGRRAPAPGHCAAGFAGRPRQYRARKD